MWRPSLVAFFLKAPIINKNNNTILAAELSQRRCFGLFGDDSVQQMQCVLEVGGEIVDDHRGQWPRDGFRPCRDQ